MLIVAFAILYVVARGSCSVLRRTGCDNGNNNNQFSGTVACITAAHCQHFTPCDMLQHIFLFVLTVQPHQVDCGLLDRKEHTIAVC